MSSGGSTPSIQLVAIHSPKHPEPWLIYLPSSLVKAATDPNDGLEAEALGSTIDYNSNSVVDISRDECQPER